MNQKRYFSLILFIYIITFTIFSMLMLRYQIRCGVNINEAIRNGGLRIDFVPASFEK